MTHDEIFTTLQSADSSSPVAVGGLLCHLSASYNLMVHTGDAYHHASPEEFAAIGVEPWRNKKAAPYMGSGLRAAVRECARDAAQIDAQDEMLRRDGYTDLDIYDLDVNGEL